MTRLTIDPNLQSQPGWHSHAGGSIGGVPPRLYTMDQSWPWADFHVEGSSVPGAYADVDWYLQRPIMANTGHLSLSYDLMVDANVASSAQAIERDTVLSLPDGYTYNFSFQIAIAEGWKLQVSDANDRWADTGFSIDPMSPSVWHHFTLAYWFDTSKHLYGISAIVIDDAFYQVPATLQFLIAELRGWSQGAIFQFQQDLTAAGGGYSELLANAKFTWW